MPTEGGALMLVTNNQRYVTLAHPHVRKQKSRNCAACTPTQMERAFTPPLMANMGTGDWPDPHNISSPVMTSFHHQSWVAAVEALSAHPIAGLCFSSFRYNSNSNVNYMFQSKCSVCVAQVLSRQAGLFWASR